MNVGNIYTKILVATLIMFYSIATLTSVSGVLLSIPQFLFIFYFIIKAKWKHALLWHLIFWCCSVSVAVASLSFEGNHDITMYNYSRLELYGPIKFSYLISVILFIKALFIKRTCRELPLFYRLYKIMYRLLFVASLIGGIGFVIDSHYSFESAVGYSLYLSLTTITLYTLMKFNSKELLKSSYEWAIALLMSAVFSCFIGFLLGIRSAYATMETYLAVDMFYYSPILIASIFLIKNKAAVIVTIACLVPLCFFSSGGKSLIILLVSTLFLLYSTLHTDKGLRKSEIKNRKMVKALFIISVFIFLAFGIADTFTISQMTKNKYESFLSMFTLDFEKIGRSPAIRVGSLANIIYNNRYNPICLIFGNGFGGYFTDELSLFKGLEVWKGGWSESVSISGYYSSAHDTIAVVPLINGLWGLYLLLNISWLFIKQYKHSFLVLAAVPWIVLTFYANLNWTFIGVFLIYASCYKIKVNKNEHIIS